MTFGLTLKEENKNMKRNSIVLTSNATCILILSFILITACSTDESENLRTPATIDASENSGDAIREQGREPIQNSPVSTPPKNFEEEATEQLDEVDANASIQENTAATSQTGNNGAQDAAMNPTPAEKFDPCRTEQAPNPKRVRRLSNREIINTLNSVMGEDRFGYEELGADIRYANFENNAIVNRVTSQSLETIEKLAEKVGEIVVESNNAFFACSVSARISQSCFNTFTDRFIGPLLRKGIQVTEQSEFERILDEFRGIFQDEPLALNALVQYLVLSSKFLYRTEIGMGDPLSDSSLSSYEIASYLSYSLLEEPPDATLMEKARANRLSQSSELREEVERLLQIKKSQQVRTSIIESVFSLYRYDSIVRSTDVFPMYTPDLIQSFKKEVQLMIEEVILNQAGGLLDVLTTEETFVNEDVAQIYGLAYRGEEFQRTRLPEGRKGILTTPGHLALLSHESIHSPFHRGTFVLKHLQCVALGDPPDGATDTKPPEDPNLVTFRQKLTAQTQGPACAGCHVLFNDAGFAFEDFDAIGAIRENDAGMPIDASGEHFLDGAMQQFSGPEEFATLLANADIVGKCSVEHTFRFVEGREPKSRADRCRITKVHEQVTGKGTSLKDTLIELLIDPKQYVRKGISP